MITRFSTLYVEHIELERCGLAGTPADDRRYPNERLADVERRYPGLDHIMLAWAIGTPRAVMVEQLTRFAREVMPAFRP